LAEDHTVRHLRETSFFPKLFDRRAVGDWRRDRKGMLDHAKDSVRQILADGDREAFLTPDQSRELERIAEHAQRARAP
jgi:trimethylamine:corrinoid methyltransferase-like protein